MSEVQDMEGVEESGNQQTTSAVQTMDVDQTFPSSRHADHQTFQSTQFQHDHQAHDPPSSFSHCQQNDIQSTNAQTFPSSSSADHQTFQNTQFQHDHQVSAVQMKNSGQFSHGQDVGGTDQPKKSEDLFTKGQDKSLLASSAGGQASGLSVDEQKQNIQTNKLQLKEDICKNDENKIQSPSEDTAKFWIKVISATPSPEKLRTKLEKALQKWFAKQENQGGKREVSVLSLKLMDNKTCAEVEITPSEALDIFKNHTTVSLNTTSDKEVITIQICLDKTQITSESDKNRNSSPKGNSTQSVTSDDTNNGAEAAAFNRDPSETKKSSPGLIVPLHQFWYILHVYKNNLELIEKQHGVSLDSEVSVSFKPIQRSSHDSVSKASEDFLKLLSECVDSCSYADINHNDMDSDFLKETIHNIQSEKTKMMFTMSATDCQFFGPKKFTDMIKRETTRAENQFKNKSNEMDVDSNSSLQSRSSLHMDIKDLQTQLEMDKVHWDLMKLSYKDQLSQLETKYRVSFNEELQKKLLKVQARSKGDQHINLESHAIRALTNLYQKLASATLSCELTKPTNKTDVASIVDELQQQHYCVVAADVFSSWKLVGLPEHLGSAIAYIEKKLQKHVFDDKMKKLIGYSEDIPHARGIRWNQVPEYSPGAVGGAGWDERVNFRAQDDSDFNKKSEDNSRHDSKGANAEEETCIICMDKFTDKKKLKCGHEFCQECIKKSVESLGPICPVCKEVFGRLEGNQPKGTMRVSKSILSLPGYSDCGTIEIYYDIPNGFQTEKHPNPGKHFQGTSRRAYLPDNREGKEVLKLLQRAFDQKLIFTVGTSTTSGLQDVVTWNDIHHKTNIYSGPINYGYPDPDYLKRVKDELKAKGIE